MSLYVFSWNMQGWNDGAKMDAMTDFFDSMNIDLSSNEVVIFLQECGHPKLCGFVEKRPIDFNDGLICQKFSVDPAADEKNQRCSTAILTSRNVNVSGRGAFFPEVNRGMLYVVSNNRIFATVHAPADKHTSVPFVKGMLRNLEDSRNGGKCQDWILMGDFNSQPEGYPIDDALHTTSLHPEIPNFIKFFGDEDNSYFCDVAFPTSYTQGEHGRRTSLLDYAFMNTDGYFSKFAKDSNNIAFCNVKIRNDEHKYLSDHNLIALEF